MRLYHHQIICWELDEYRRSTQNSAECHGVADGRHDDTHMTETVNAMLNCVSAVSDSTPYL